MSIIEWLQQPMPWYIGGLLIGLMVPTLLLIGNKQLGISSSLRHTCAALLPSKAAHFNYDWKAVGSWNLLFAVGIVFGGVIASNLLTANEIISISEATKTDLRTLGITDFSGFLPSEIFSWQKLLTLPGMLLMVGGGFLVGFGARYANGCTSGHAIMGMSLLAPSSLIAVLGFFAGGLLVTHFALPFIFNLF